MNQRLHRTAYYNWLNAAAPHGQDLHFWCNSERELIGYTRGEFDHLRCCYQHEAGFMFDAPSILTTTKEQVESLVNWGVHPLWVVDKDCVLPNKDNPYDGFDYQAKRSPCVKALFERMKRRRDEIEEKLENTKSLQEKKAWFI